MLRINPAGLLTGGSVASFFIGKELSLLCEKQDSARQLNRMLKLNDRIQNHQRQRR
jgi:hypothetical protein